MIRITNTQTMRLYLLHDGGKGADFGMAFNVT